MFDLNFQRTIQVNPTFLYMYIYMFWKKYHVHFSFFKNQEN